SEDLINVGAYVKGSNPEIDRAIELNPSINDYLTQRVNESFNFEDTIKLLEKAVTISAE
ncbi:MAG: EscN/YscN/HrcN family type III secretion system ATPase, partial [Clostridiaceae bacterium]|nr:EscN/YscN/HrcN family type III secretion system ATPase [Clostridiaceae bacterium]